MVIYCYQGSLGDISQGSHQSGADISYILVVIYHYQGSLGDRSRGKSLESMVNSIKKCYLCS